MRIVDRLIILQVGVQGFAEKTWTKSERLTTSALSHRSTATENFLLAGRLERSNESQTAALASGFIADVLGGTDEILANASDFVGDISAITSDGLEVVSKQAQSLHNVQEPVRQLSEFVTTRKALLGKVPQSNTSAIATMDHAIERGERLTRKIQDAVETASALGVMPAVVKLVAEAAETQGLVVGLEKLGAKPKLTLKDKLQLRIRID